ncbi:MAG TPA: keto-hydroxyglutarate-aldolase/keto-deoxy-phosphogluconate aldolase, partial [Thermomonas sp.]|nr:keto-hydroxyglutarate-aldolase/keto-deoxy-phosphogluconate aldolase [Thermomonas sp.]
MTDTASHASQVDAVFARAPVIPVLTIERIEDAIPLARALSDNGLPVLEVTLRSACAVDAIALIARELADACVGAGTVLSARDLDAVVQAGARFAISPGATDTLYHDAADCPIPLIPGIATASELMRGLEHGWQRFKFFPA